MINRNCDMSGVDKKYKKDMLLSRAEQSRAEQLYHNKIAHLNIIFSVLIVIRHTVNIDTYGLTSGFLYHFEKAIAEATSSIVPMFYAMSGYLFFQNLEWGRIKVKIYSRFKSLFIPYVVWCLISFFFYQILNRLPVIRTHINQIVEPITCVNMLRSVMYHTNNGPLWFLQYLIGYIALAPVVFFFLENNFSKKYRRCYRVFVLLIIFAAAILLPNGFWGYFVSFVFGAGAGRYFKGVVYNSYSMLIKIIAVTVVFLSILIGMSVDLGRLYMIFRIIQICAIWIIADGLRTEKEPNEKIRISFIIFCAHTLILEPSEKMILLIFGRTFPGAILDLLLAPTITIGILLVFAHLCQKMPLFWKVLNGGR